MTALNTHKNRKANKVNSTKIQKTSKSKVGKPDSWTDRHCKLLTLTVTHRDDDERKPLIKTNPNKKE